MTSPLPPGFRRMALTACAMTATIMQALDSTIANVALPYMQGSLSASLDQINWVLTSYILAAAIMTAPIAWLAGRFGRKRLFIVCSAGFTVASVLCASAHTIEQMVLYRALQAAHSLYRGGTHDADALRTVTREVLAKAPEAGIDYVSVADPSSLRELDRVRPGALVLVAVRFGLTRLIDNIRL